MNMGVGHMMRSLALYVESSSRRKTKKGRVEQNSESACAARGGGSLERAVPK